MLRKSSRVSRILTERSSNEHHPANSVWFDDLEDSEVSGPHDVLPKNSRLLDNTTRNSKWFTNLDDSVNVPPPLTAESSSRSDSTFSSGKEMSGKRPAPRREIMGKGKRKRDTSDRFAAIFDPDEPPDKRRSSSIKHSSSGSVYEDTSPISQPKKSTRKGTLFSKKESKSHSSNYDKVFDKSGDSDLIIPAFKVSKSASELDRSDSPELRRVRSSQRVQSNKTTRTRTRRSEFEISSSSSGGTSSKNVSSRSNNSPSPVSKFKKSQKKVMLSKQQKKAVTTSVFDKAFSDDEDDGTPDRSLKNSLPSVSDRSQSPMSKSTKSQKKVMLSKQQMKAVTTSAFDKAFSDDEDDGTPDLEKSLHSVSSRSKSAAKSKRLSTKVIITRKSQSTRSDLEIVSDDEDPMSNDDVEQMPSGSSPAISKSTKSQKKLMLSKQQKKAVITSDFDKAFSDDENDGTPDRSLKNSLPSVSDGSQSPMSKSTNSQKKVMLSKQQKKAVTTSAFDKAFSDDEDDGTPDRSLKNSLPSVSDRSQSPMSKSTKSQKKVMLSKQQKKAVTTSAFDKAFSDDEDDGTPDLEKSLRSVSSRSKSAAKSKRLSTKVISTRKSRSTRPDLEIVSDDEDPMSNVDVEQMPSGSSPAISKSTISQKKVILSKQQKKAVTTSDFDKAFSDDEDGGTPDRSLKNSLPSVSDRSQSPMSKSTNSQKKVMLSKQQKKAVTTSAFDKAFSDDEDDGTPDRSLKNSLPSVSDRSQSPMSKSTKSQKKVMLLKQQKKAVTTSDFDKAFSDDEDEAPEHFLKRSQRLVSDKKSPTKLGGLPKTIPLTKKSLIDDNEVISRSHDESIHSSFVNQSPSVSHKVQRRETAVLLHKKQKATSKSAFDNFSFSSDGVEATNSGQKVSQALSATRRSKSPAEKTGKGLKQALLSKKSGLAEAPDVGNTSYSSKPLIGLENEDNNYVRDTSLYSKGSKPPSSVKTNNSRSALKKDNLGAGGSRSQSRKEANVGEAASTSVVKSLDRSHGVNKDTLANTLPKSSDSQKVPLMTPISGPSTLLLAHEANFTNFNPQANSTKVLHLSNSLNSVASVATVEASYRKMSTAKLRGGNGSPQDAQPIVSVTAAAPKSPIAQGSVHLPSRKESRKDVSDSDVSIIGTWSVVGSVQNMTVSDTTPASSGLGSPEVVAAKKSLPAPAITPPAQVPIPASTIKTYTAEEAAARRKEYFATLLERAKRSYPELVADAPVKKKTMTDFYPKATAVPKVRKEPKPVHPSLMVNGKKWKPPKLARPAQWCTDRLYSFVQKRTTELYGELKTRRKSEEFLTALAYSVKKAIRCKKNFVPHVLRVVYLLKRLGLIESLMDFYVFVENYMAYDFSEVAVPKTRAYGVITGPKCFVGANVIEPLDFSKFPDFEK